MVFMPPRSLGLVNKSEVLPKSLDKQSSGEMGRVGTSAGKGGVHELGPNHPAYMGTSHTQLCVSPLAQRRIWLSHTPARGVFGPALSLNLMETPSLSLTNVKKQSLPMVFKPLLL